MNPFRLARRDASLISAYKEDVSRMYAYRSAACVSIMFGRNLRTKLVIMNINYDICFCFAQTIEILLLLPVLRCSLPETHAAKSGGNLGEKCSFTPHVDHGAILSQLKMSPDVHL